MKSHPYYPLDASLPGYAPNEAPIARVISIFGEFVSIIVCAAYWCATRIEPPLRGIDQFAVSWFVLCGFLHMTFEGYFVYYKDAMASHQGLFGHLWKEYALSDSRYLTGDVFTICIETITVFCWGPLSLLTASSILANSSTRHFYQVIVCTAHLYGVALYYLTNWAEFTINGISYSRPEFLYYWVYYIGFNMPWVVVPLVLLVDSWRNISAAFIAQKQLELQKKDS